MVVADASLLRDVRRLAIRDELLAMRLRGMLVVPQGVAAPAGRPPVAAPSRAPTTRRTRRRP